MARYFFRSASGARSSRRSDWKTMCVSTGRPTWGGVVPRQTASSSRRNRSCGLGSTALGGGGMLGRRPRSGRVGRLIVVCNHVLLSNFGMSICHSPQNRSVWLCGSFPSVLPTRACGRQTPANLTTSTSAPDRARGSKPSKIHCAKNQRPLVTTRPRAAAATVCQVPHVLSPHHDGRKLTEVPDRTSMDMIEGTY